MARNCIGTRVGGCVALIAGLLFVGTARAAERLAGNAVERPAGTAGESLMAAAQAACQNLTAQRAATCQPLRVEQHLLGAGLTYSRFLVRVGAGEHDVIALHRVVRDRQPNRGEGLSRVVFMMHGDLWGFVAAFAGLTVHAVPRETSLPVYLARNGVDVWGISFRWAQIPVGFPSGSYMANWGLDTAISDARIGLRIARVVRLLTGHGGGGIHLLGWSRGVWTTVAVANAEAVDAPALRDVAGLIAVDGAFKLGPEDELFRQSWCSDHEVFQSLLTAGVYGLSNAFFPLIGQLAIDAPDGQSPYDSDLTNAQYAMGVASFPANWPGFEWYHFMAGTFDDGGEPTGLVYSDPALWFVVMTEVFGYDPVLLLADTSAVSCDELDVPWDDHLDEVRNPILYIAAGGGFGDVGAYLLELIASDDVTAIVVREQPEDLAELDIGHVDIFAASESRELFWEPILAWLTEH